MCYVDITSKSGSPHNVLLFLTKTHEIANVSLSKAIEIACTGEYVLDQTVSFTQILLTKAKYFTPPRASFSMDCSIKNLTN